MAVDAFGNIVPDTVPGTGPLPDPLATSGDGESKIDPALRPYLQMGLQRAQQLFFGTQPSLFPGQMYVSPSEQSLAALSQQEALATQPSPVLSAAQNAFLSGLGAQSGALPLYQNIYGAAGARPGVGLYERAAAGQLGPSTGRFEQLYGAAAPGVPSALTRAAEGGGAIGTSFLGGLTQQAGIQPAAGLYGQVAGGGFQNLALPGTAQTAAGSFLTGSPYQQAMIEAATRPLVQQFGETVIPGISSQFSRAGRYGSGAMERAQARATEAFGRSLGDITAGIVGQEYGRERGFQEAARQQLAGLSQQDLANRLAAAGALESSLRGGIAQQAGLFGQQAALEQQNLATQLQAAQAAEATRQAQLAQQTGLAGQIAGLQQQNVATQLAGAGGLEQAQQAALGTQLQAAGGLGATQAQDIQRQLQAASMAPSFFQMSFLPSQALAQVGASREAIAAQPLQEQIQRYQYSQMQPYQALQGYLSSVYGTPMGSSQYPQMPQAQTNKLGQGLGGALVGSQIGNLFGGFGGFSGSQIGAGLGGLAGLLF